MAIPRSYPFRELKRKLLAYRIQWLPRRGKGSHGAFVGPDKRGNKQSYTLPQRQQREVRKWYLRDICRRFLLDPDDLFG